MSLVVIVGMIFKGVGNWNTTEGHEQVGVIFEGDCGFEGCPTVILAPRNGNEYGFHP